MKGIYIVANDRVSEEAIALLNSIKKFDQETPIVLIPYDEKYQAIAKLLNNSYGVKLFHNLDFLQSLTPKIDHIFGQNFFARPHQFRKQACWFGEFNEFLYLDTDIVVFEKIINNLNYLQDYDFICCDYQYKSGLTNVFTSKIMADGIFTEQEIKDIFNGGFWGGKKGLITETELWETFRECAQHPEYFDFAQKTSDQPIINYLILKRIKRRLNLVQKPHKGPGNWAGSPHFQRQGNILIDPKTNQPLQYLHWAGMKIKPGCPYWDIWKYYRYLKD
ncbi:MAG: methionine synthase [Gomphosphaeria aponina SAG 52.96 = DSM 107014]|uniref:Methionine synthase n=1 Tax=Gomphosphaeria aponina SAG 52.96 = DSM 107014 TaxID=1521640 RepID=A0A941JQK6_9CHRO|nr:methionine synthase [Gomphosphaeria aponina SAG 52.96 = DSM 107014]